MIYLGVSYQISLGLYHLGFDQLIESISLYLWPNLEKFQPLLHRIFFSHIHFLLSFWEFNDIMLNILFYSKVAEFLLILVSLVYFLFHSCWVISTVLSLNEHSCLCPLLSVVEFHWIFISAIILFNFKSLVFLNIFYLFTEIFLMLI